MGNCFKPHANQASEGGSRERLAVHGEGSSRARASYSHINSRGRLSRSSSNRGEESRLRDRFDSNDRRQLLLHSQSNSSMPIHADDFDDIRNRMEFVFRAQHPGLRGIARGRQGEQVAAGWPAWLSEAACEAIQGWIPRKEDSFERLDKIGQGTYSNVYRARDLEEGKIVALKKIKFDSCDSASIRFMAREIHILRRLQHPNIIKLEGVVVSEMSCTVYLVFEYMEHDLARLLSRPGLTFTEPQIKCYMKQMLRGLDYCHRHGILHRDIKSSNLLAGSDGILKIADFGLANFYNQRQVEPMTNRVVTLWYRPPELLLGATRYGTAIDLWSTGCVLAEFYAGEPIMTGRTEVEQLQEIFKLCGSPSEEFWRNCKLPHATRSRPQQPYKKCIAERFKDFPAPAIDLIETLLSIDPDDRPSAAQVLNSEFFWLQPLACEPAEMSKYQSSRVMDARVRAEEAQRQAKARSKGKRCVIEVEDVTESQAIAAPEISGLLSNKYASQLEAMKPVRKPGSYNEGHDSLRKYGENSSRDQLLYFKDNKSNHTEPFLAPSNMSDQMGRDHAGRHVRETSRHAHADKAKQRRAQGEAIPLPTNALYVGPRDRIKQEKVHDHR
ncbi:hypothetical protein ACET3Z_023129 [Daucus carota]